MRIFKTKVSELPLADNIDNLEVLGLDATTNKSVRANMTQLRGNKGDQGVPGPKGPKGDPGSSTQRIVSIGNFTFFDPATDLIDTNTGESFVLEVGESCQFQSSADATGSPSMGANVPLSDIHYWAGTITRIHSDRYMMTAYGDPGMNPRYPQIATRMYGGNTYTQWLIGTEYSTGIPDGYIKFPSGLLIQWGSSGSGAAERLITFPIPFSTSISVVQATARTTGSGTTINIVNVSASSGSGFAARIITIGAGTVTPGVDVPFNWVATGVWRTV